MTTPKPLTFSPRRGRPRKFLEQSRALTLTLPEPVIAALSRIDPDVSRAIVRLAQPEMRTDPHAAAELASFGRHALIVVNPTRTLERRTGVLLVPLSDGRALIAFDEDMTPEGLELRIQDELEDPKLPAEDRRIFEGIRDLLKTARRSESIVIRSPQIMVLEHVGPAKRRKRRATPHAKETE